MKQIFYGPTGCGKSHIILHNIQHFNKRAIIFTANGSGTREFSYVGIKDIPTTLIPIKEIKENTYYIEDVPVQEKLSGVYCFEHNVHTIDHSNLIEASIEWMEKNRITEDPDNIILFINIYTLLSNREKADKILKRMERWPADVIIIEHTLSLQDVDFELANIRKSGKWFEIPIINKNQNDKYCNKDFESSFPKNNKVVEPVGQDMCTCPKCGTYNEIVIKRRNTVATDIIYCWHCGQAISIN